MATDYFSATGFPSTNALAVSASARSEFTAIEAGFAKLPTFSGNGSKIVAVNSGATGLEAITTTGTGSGVRATSPTLVTPTIGVATATSINKVAITAPAASATLTIADGKTLTASNTITMTATDGSTAAFGAGLAITAAKTFSVSNTLTLAGTDGTTMTFPSTSATIARTDAANTFTGNQTFSGVVLGSDGDVSAPGLSFSGDTDTGFYRLGADSLGLAIGGAMRMRANTTGTTFGIGASNPFRIGPEGASIDLVTYAALTTTGLELGGPAVTVPLKIYSSGGMVQVVGARVGGYTNAMTGAANRATSYDTSSITLVELAQRVKALQDDITTHGLIGV